MSDLATTTNPVTTAVADITNQAVHERNYYKTEQKDALLKVLKSVAPELLEKVTKDNANASPEELTKALINSVRADVLDPNGRTYALGQLYLKTNPEVVTFMKEAGGDLSASAIKFLELLGGHRSTFGDRSALEGVQEIKNIQLEEKKFIGDAALRTALEKSFPAAAEKLVTADTTDANAALLNELREGLKKNALFTSGFHADTATISRFINSNDNTLNPDALVALRAFVDQNSLPGLSLAGKGPEITKAIVEAADSRGWKYNQDRRSYADIGNSASHEINFYENRKGEILNTAMEKISPEVAARVKAMNLEGSPRNEAFVAEFRKELNDPNSPLKNLIQLYKTADPSVAAFLTSTDNSLSAGFISTMNRFANNQASFGNKTASDAMTALFNETKNSATYDADMRTKKVLDTMFPSTSASSAQAGQSTYEQIGSMIQNLREDLTKLGALYLQPSSGLAPVIRAFLQSNSNELNAESLGALRAYVAIKAPPPGLAAGRVEEFNKAIDATAAQRGFSYNPATMSYKS